MKRFSCKPADLAVAVLILAVGLALLLFRDRSGSVTATVSVSGETLYVFMLKDVTEPSQITLPNGIVIELAPSAIRFVSSPCRGQDCVGFGWLSHAGQAAACLPYRTLITLSGQPAGQTPDALSY